jgi:glycosyltransferase involved in cell wall biosynthesis
VKFAISFTNFGPYHLARLRALANRLAAEGGALLAYETASTEARYPWQAQKGTEPFQRVTLFPGETLENLSRALCVKAMLRALERDNPDALGIVGYARPESTAALAWARRHRKPTILMSESQECDRPRVWWKEAIKSRRVQRFSAAVVGGPRHRDYLVKLGMPAERIALGYNAVDHAWFSEVAGSIKRTPIRPSRPPYFLAVSRFTAEKNLPRLVRAFGRYRRDAINRGSALRDLVLCGDGADAMEIESAVHASGFAEAIHRPGFLQAESLVCWYAFASAFVLASVSEPWGLVANEAAACGVPLLISNRAGCVDTLVPEPPGTTGWRFDPANELGLAALLSRMAALPETERIAMGARAAAVASDWGPDRFARGTLEAIAIARDVVRTQRSRPHRGFAHSGEER